MTTEPPSIDHDPTFCVLCQSGTHTAEFRPEREGREGDTQPMPIGNDLPIAHRMVQEDLEARLALGIKRYGQPLQPHNGRNALRDLYEELLDACVYLRTLLYEQEHPDDV